jgi:hypothetical protein
MRPTLPRGSRQKLHGFALLPVAVSVALAAASGACAHDPQPVAPGPPIPAQEELTVDTYDKECAALIAALNDYAQCPNADDDERAWIRATIEYAERSFAAGKKGLDAHPDADGAKAMAVKCRVAAISIGNAHQRCNAGPKPRVDD